ncbi:P-loop containing nucleoside triphosphate hydrolase protein [Panus rudis PR-1116 ss-1]|nr:P-loop containing nucleoside triphosphate hydrolase protein [Panus rudis PR-1116 ss-1]
MVKRRAHQDDSDTESPDDASQASKRARTSPNDEDELERRAGIDSKRHVNGKGKARRNGVEELEDEDEDTVIEQAAPDQEEEKRFEEEHEDQLRAKVLGKTKTQGGIAEMGIVEELEMHQFMCHKYLTFKFGPQINFIIGGKSAVLSALTVALGGKAATTGRGNGLKSFIREGQSAAEVTVVLKNQGEEAYRHNDYGDSIVITRRFTKDGSSSYKIKSKDGKVISTKREELSAICDHMNIQVDNPMNILTQDSARQFLSASQPADKYKFFLRGTQLQQLSDEYEICLENINQTQKVLLHKSEAIPDLEEAFAEAEARFKEAKKARDQKRRVDELKNELAWAHVNAKEREMTTKIEELERLKRRVTKVQEKVQEAEAKEAEANEIIMAHEEKMEALGQIQHLNARKADLNSKIRKIKGDLAGWRREESQINASIESLKAQIQELGERIQTEEAKMQALTQDKRDETHRRLDQAIEAVKAAEAKLDDLRRQKARLEQEAFQAHNKSQELEKQQQQLKDKLVGADHQIRMCAEAEKNKLSVFGRNMDQVLREIERTRWKGEKPIGPFGAYVKVKDPQSWAYVLQVQLGQLMSGFAVSNVEDRAELDKILKRYGNNNVSITITERDLFDYSAGEPPENYLTVLRALEISDPFVLRILINQASIERFILAKSRAEADAQLERIGQGVAWTADLFRVERFRSGGGRSNTMNPLNPSDPKRQLFIQRGENARAMWEHEKAKIEQEMMALNGEIAEVKQTYNRCKRAEEQLKQQERSAYEAVRRAKSERDRLQDEANEEQPVEIMSLKEELQRLEEDKESQMQQFEELQRQKLQGNASMQPLVDQLNAVQEEISHFEERAAVIQASYNSFYSSRLQSLMTHLLSDEYNKKLQEEQTKVDTCQEAVNVLQEEYQNWTAKAEQFCTRIETSRKPEEIERQIHSVTSALREREKRDGVTVEEMTVEVNKRKAALDKARQELRSMALLNKALRKSIKYRLKKWHEFRRHIALRCKIYFAYHLSQRGYYGKVIFDHVAGTLSLKVQTDDMAPTQGGSREKDPRSLSGGEKSFSTICLLLSLWESIGCPIRCLDEFDVFMDAVNRRISMKMMIDTANASNRKQYILITPQDMTNITIGNTVRVHRMRDPERNQGVLSFAG